MCIRVALSNKVDLVVHDEHEHVTIINRVCARKLDLPIYIFHALMRYYEHIYNAMYNTEHGTDLQPSIGRGIELCHFLDVFTDLLDDEGKAKLTMFMPTQTMYLNIEEFSQLRNQYQTHVQHIECQPHYKQLID